MSAEFVTGGTRADAAHWNSLFAELDRKMTLWMSDKSPAITGADWRYGKAFFFNNGPGTRPRSDSLATGFGAPATYDHTPYINTSEAADLGVQVADEDKKLLRLALPINEDWSPYFIHSLEAHRRLYNSEYYWLWEFNIDRPERISSYGLAELFVEGLTTLTFEERWNKYRFFRIHNLGDTATTVAFPGHNVTVPALACRCVRRDTATSGYTDGFNYFNRFQHGDPRIFQMPYDGTTPHGSMGANNVISPAVVYTLLFHLEGIVWSDNHHLYDVGALYADYFATA